MVFPLYFLRAASSFAANSFVSSAAVTTASFSFFSWATSDAAREEHSTADARSSERTGLRMRIGQLLGTRIHNKAHPTARSALSRWFRRGKPASLFYDNALNLRPIDLLG